MKQKNHTLTLLHLQVAFLHLPLVEVSPLQNMVLQLMISCLLMVLTERCHHKQHCRPTNLNLRWKALHVLFASKFTTLLSDIYFTLITYFFTKGICLLALEISWQNVKNATTFTIRYVISGQQFNATVIIEICYFR